MAEVRLEDAPQSVRDTFNRGFTAFERGNLDYAIHLLSQCLAAEPGLLQARRFLRAAELQKVKNTGSNPLTRFVATVKSLPVYLKAMGQVKAGKPDQALIAAEELLKIDPMKREFIRIFVEAAARANLPEAAIQTLEIARDRYPNDIRILNWLGTLYQKVGRMRSARECFESLSELTPNDPDAMKALKDAMALDSMSTDGWTETAESGGTFRDMIRDTAEAELLEQEAKAVRSEKDVEALIEDVVARLEAEPANMNYYRSLGRLYAQKGSFDEAIAILEKAKDVNASDPEIDNSLNAIRTQAFDHRIAEQRKAGDMEGADEVEAEKKAFTFENLRERVQRYPNDLRLRYDWGIMLYENAQMNDAIQQFQLSQKNPKYRVRSFYYLAMCFQAKEQYDLALDQLKRASAEIMTMDDTKKEITYRMGEVAEAMGNEEAAAGYYKNIYQVDIGYKDVAKKIERAYGDRMFKVEQVDHRFMFADKSFYLLVIIYVYILHAVAYDKTVEIYHDGQPYGRVFSNLYRLYGIVVRFLRVLAPELYPSGVPCAHRVRVVAMYVDRRGKRPVYYGHHYRQPARGGDIYDLPHQRQAVGRGRCHRARARAGRTYRGTHRAVLALNQDHLCIDIPISHKARKLLHERCLRGNRISGHHIGGYLLHRRRYGFITCKGYVVHLLVFFFSSWSFITLASSLASISVIIPMALGLAGQIWAHIPQPLQYS